MIETKRFSPEDITRLRKKYKDNPSTINLLKKRVNNIFEHDINVQKTSKASWNHYFFCKEHSTRLEWDIDSPHKFKCPVDGKIFSGEPYEGAWWCKLNDYNIEFIKVAPFIWMVTEEKKYLDKAIEIIMQYANNFENYKATGGIPDNENNFGIIGGQTLYDSIYMTDLAKGYDIIRTSLTQEQRDTIENKLLLPLVEHLKKQHVQHLHNHEIKAVAGVGIIGIILEKNDLVEYALNHPYAILDNLDRGFSKDNLWFENSTFYHLYSVAGLLAFESFAYKTKYSLKKHAKFYESIVSPTCFLLPNSNLISINDMMPGQEILQHAGTYEFCNFLFPNDDKIIFILNEIYRNRERTSTEAFIYGDKEIPKAKINYAVDAVSQNISANGLRLYRFKTRSGDSKMTVFNYSKYSGEHNHHDPLSLIIFGYDEQIMPDLGTTGYGSPMHKQYYKTTPMHNTISIEKSNQPARDPQLLEDTIISEKEIQTIAQVDFNGSVPELDSDFNIEWDESIYKDIVITRYVNWTPTYIIEVTNVKNPNGKKVQWNNVYDGKVENEHATFSDSINISNCENPYRYFKNSIKNNIDGFEIKIKGKNSDLKVMTRSLNKTTNILSDTPANPADRMIKHLLRETDEEDVWFATVYEHRLEGHHESTNFKFDVNKDSIDIKVIGKKEHIVKFKKY